MMQLQHILMAAEAQARTLFVQRHNDKLLYHNLAHTEGVVAAAKKIVAHYQLEETDNVAIIIAAWFHDIGYLLGPPEQHEAAGAEQAALFLRSKEAPEALIAKVEHLILATRMPQSPQTLLQQIICDADLFGFGQDDFMDKTKLLRRERELLTGTTISGSQWRTDTISLLQQHQYFTDYARALQQNGKAGNIAALQKRQEKKAAKDAAIPAAIPLAAATSSEKKKKKNSDEADTETGKSQSPGRGTETMFRLTSTNHLQLSAMADNKANILVTVNSIIITVLISVLFRRLETSPHLTIPTIIFLGMSITTIIFSVLATRPNVNPGRFSRNDIAARKTNLLFFGNFYRMHLDEYEWAMKEMINDREYLYGSLIKDIYFLGAVLGRKYRLLRIAYNIFMYGLILSVVAFAIAIFVFDRTNTPPTAPLQGSLFKQ
jgi:predicted metal-dependent HD superfamily phosphohydrolase